VTTPVGPSGPLGPLGLGHLDDTERQCERHGIDLDALLHLAVLGARTPSFNHDIASKIQGVMMALDELTELATTPELVQSADMAHSALRELNELLKQNRTLAKVPVATRVPLQELVTRAAQRVGVSLECVPIVGDVKVAVPVVTQAFALAIDAAAGIGRRRPLAIEVARDGAQIQLVLPLAPGAELAGETLAIAAWVFARAGGGLRCGTAITTRIPWLG